MNEQELIELLADKHHDSWARWMHSLFSKCEQGNFGQMVIPAEFVARWWGQADTSYAELSEPEKQSDRAEVAHILPIIKEYTARLPIQDEWTQAIRLHIQKLNEQSVDYKEERNT